jgi:hypothetical protein
MYARQTTAQIDPSRVDELLRTTREQTVPLVQQQGAKGLRLFVDRGTGKVVIVSLFASAAAAQAAAAALNQNRDERSRELGVSATTELFEVAVIADF